MHTGEGEEPMRTIYADVDREEAFQYQRHNGNGIPLSKSKAWKVVEEESG